MSVKPWLDGLSRLLWKHRVYEAPVQEYLQTAPSVRNPLWYHHLLSTYAKHRVPSKYVMPLIDEIRNQNLLKDHTVLSGLLYWYCQRKDTKSAELIANELGTNLTIGGRTALIRCFEGEPDKAMFLFETAPERDTWVYNAILQVLMRHARWDQFQRVVKSLQQSQLQGDLVTRKLLFESFIKRGMSNDALSLFNREILPASGLSQYDLRELQNICRFEPTLQCAIQQHLGKYE